MKCNLGRDAFQRFCNMKRLIGDQKHRNNQIFTVSFSNTKIRVTGKIFWINSRRGEKKGMRVSIYFLNVLVKFVVPFRVLF